jgi:tetratricopeptide (TPR) repeat protein
VLTELTRLEEHEAPIYRRLLSLLVSRKAYVQAVEVGEAAVYVDMEGSDTHSLYAQALAGTGKLEAAAFEFESALLTPSRPAELAGAHLAYAEFLKSRGHAERAQAEIAKARELAPDHPLLSPPATP